MATTKKRPAAAKAARKTPKTAAEPDGAGAAGGTAGKSLKKRTSRARPRGK